MMNTTSMMPQSTQQATQQATQEAKKKREPSAPRSTSPPVILSCDQPGCNFTCGKNSALKLHRTNAHGIDSALHRCTIAGCDYKAKIGGHLKRHLANIHDVDVVWYTCDQDGCAFKTKEASNLRCHRKRVHQITWTAMRTHTPKLKILQMTGGGADAVAGLASLQHPQVHQQHQMQHQLQHQLQSTVGVSKPATDQAPKPQPPKVTL